VEPFENIQAEDCRFRNWFSPLRTGRPAYDGTVEEAQELLRLRGSLEAYWEDILMK